MAKSRRTAVDERSPVKIPCRRRRRRNHSDNHMTSFKRQHHQEPYRNLNWRKDMDWDRYKKEMKAYEGFYLTKAVGIGGPGPSPPDSDFVVAAANFAVKVYNRKKRKGAVLKLNKVIRSTVGGGSIRVHSLTLATSNGRFYETKVHTCRGVGVKLELFRPAVHYPVRKPINMHSKQTYKTTPRHCIRFST